MADSGFLKVSGIAEIKATRERIAPLLFDLMKIQDYHVALNPDAEHGPGSVEIIGDQLEGIGAKRKLWYTKQWGGTTFYETVVETNGVDSIKFELTEHPWPAEKLYAVLSIAKVSCRRKRFTFTMAIEYKLKPGASVREAKYLKQSLETLTQGTATKAQSLFQGNPISRLEDSDSDSDSEDCNVLSCLFKR